MRIIPIDEVYNLNYSINVINGLKQYWQSKTSFSCIDTPKKVNMLLYLNGINAEYTTKKSETMHAYSGDVVYTPIGSEYSVTFNKHQKDACTTGINFLIYDEHNQLFSFSDEIMIFRSLNNANYAALFEKTDRYSEAAIPCPGNMKAGMYEVISMLSKLSRSRKPSKFDIIMKGISYLENSPDTNVNIEDIANICNVSPSYFRRLFKEYAKISPKEYLIDNKLKKAKLYLEYENMTIDNIASQLHFTDASYFSKQFKIKTGMTPTEYRNHKNPNG